MRNIIINANNNTYSHIELLYLDENTSNENILTEFIKPVWNSLSIILNQNVNTKLNSELNFKYYLLICFLGVLVLGFLVVWLPMQYSLNDEITRTKNMLDIIPRSVIKEINSYIEEN